MREGGLLHGPSRKQNLDLEQALPTLINYPPKRELRAISKIVSGIPGTSILYTVPPGKKITIVKLIVINAGAANDISIFFANNLVLQWYSIADLNNNYDWILDDGFVIRAGYTISFSQSSALDDVQLIAHFYEEPDSDTFR